MPPSIPHRSARVFADLLHVLKGYPLEIRSEEHRQELLRDARYFHLKGLEQRLIPHTISYNLARNTTEIVIRLEDVRQSGIVFVPNKASKFSSEDSPAGRDTTSSSVRPGLIHYQRPYVDSEAYSLLLEVTGEEGTLLSLLGDPGYLPARVAMAAFQKQTLARITSLFSVIAAKMNVPVANLIRHEDTGSNDRQTKVLIGPDADVMLDGRSWFIGSGSVNEKADRETTEGPGEPTQQHKQGGKNVSDSREEPGWVVKKAQWRLCVQPVHVGGRKGVEVVLAAVKIDAISNDRARNAARAFLA